MCMVLFTAIETKQYRRIWDRSRKPKYLSKKVKARGLHESCPLIPKKRQGQVITKGPYGSHSSEQ
jgi:hypothetical protein